MLWSALISIIWEWVSVGSEAVFLIPLQYITELMIMLPESQCCWNWPKSWLLILKVISEVSLWHLLSGEEMGLLGSKKYVDDPMINLKSVDAMVNLDMGWTIDRQYQIANWRRRHSRSIPENHLWIMRYHQTETCTCRRRLRTFGSRFFLWQRYFRFCSWHQALTWIIIRHPTHGIKSTIREWSPFGWGIPDYYKYSQFADTKLIFKEAGPKLATGRGISRRKGVIGNWVLCPILPEMWKMVCGADQITPAGLLH